MDNAPGHFEEFYRRNVIIKSFPPNCTSWKQPLDLGIIAAIKKRYKHIYLNDMLSFYSLDKETKAKMKQKGKEIR